MAEAKLTVGVEMELEPGPVTREWLIGLGWVPPTTDADGSVQTEPEEEEDGDWDPAEMMAVDVASLVPEAQPLRDGGQQAMTGVEAMRHRARQLRTRLRGELADEGAQQDLDELLRMCDVNMKRVFGEDCDC